jgi:hypothetical protein
MELKEYEKDIQSQYGEDGVIEEIFRRIGTINKYCVEFGAWDGVHLSNTWNLWHNNNWHALLIEGDESRYEPLKQNTMDFSLVNTLNEFVGIEGEGSLDSILTKINAPEIIDFLSVDIDGDDYHIFSSLRKFKPRLIVIEYNPTIPPHLDIVQEPGEYFGASALAYTKLAQEKDYKLVHITDTNLFFVQSADFGKMNMEEINLAVDFKYENLTTVITAFDGNEFLSQKPPFKWKIPGELKEKRIFGLFNSKSKEKKSIPMVRTSSELVKVKIYKED